MPSRLDRPPLSTCNDAAAYHQSRLALRQDEMLKAVQRLGQPGQVGKQHEGLVNLSL